MSGGSLDYIQFKIDDAAGSVLSRSHGRSDGPLLRAFAQFLQRVGQACHAIEWDFSGDSSLKEKDYALIRDLMGPAAELGQATQEAREVMAALGKAIRQAEGAP